MRPAFRIVPAALAAFVVALALVTSAQSHRSQPPPSHESAHTVSANVPYVAPWQTGFEKFATQLYAPTTVSANEVAMTIPDGQWWRIIYLTAQYTASVTAGNRLVEAQVWDPSGVVVLRAATPIVLAASAVGTFLFGPGLTGFGNVSALTLQFGESALPDVLWPPKASVHIIALGGLGNDAMQVATFAVEIYTEDRPGVLTPKLTPTPLIP